MAVLGETAVASRGCNVVELLLLPTQPASCTWQSDILHEPVIGVRFRDKDAEK